jgi:hypothetical protein
LGTGQRLHVLWAFLIFLVCTVVFTYPVARDLTTTLPHDPGDPVLETWFLWWGTHVVPFTQAWWNSGFFHPTPDVMTFSENLLGILPITAAVQWTIGNPLLAYNVAFLCSFLLSALGAYLLCFELTGRRDASFIAGFAFGFAPYRVDQVAHLQVLTAYWLPMTFFALHRYLRNRHWGWLGLFAVMYVLQALSNLYLLLYIPLAVFLWSLWFARSWRDFTAVAIAGACGAAILVPMLLKYSAAHEFFGHTRDLSEIKFYSADLTAILAPGDRVANWQFLHRFNRAEGRLFPGLTVIAVITAGIFLSVRRRHPEWPAWYRVVEALFATVLALEVLAFAVRVAVGPWETRVLGRVVSVTSLDHSALLILFSSLTWAATRLLINRKLTGRVPSVRAWLSRVGKVHACFTLGLVLTIAALALRLAIGPWHIGVPGLTLSVDRVDKSIAMIGYFSLAWLLSTPRAIAARRSGSAFPFYVLTAAIIYLLAMGPVPSLRGEPVFYQAPYGWLLRLPGFEGLRVPTRIWIVAVLFLAIGAALAYGRLVARTVPVRIRYVAVAVIGACLLADGWFSELPTVPPPRRSAILEQHGAGPLLEIPTRGDDLGAMYRSIFHEELIGNGYSGFFPPYYGLLGATIAAMGPNLPTELATLGFRQVSVNRELDEEHRLEALFSAAPGVQRVAGDEHDVLFDLPAVSKQDLWAPPPGVSLKIAAVRASSNTKLIERMFDGNRDTRWDGGIQAPGQELLLDLGSTQAVAALGLGLGPYETDYPRLLSVEASTDGQEWVEVWKGPTEAVALMGSMSDPKGRLMRVPVGRAARWLRVRQEGRHHEYLWSVTELKVFGQ